MILFFSFLPYYVSVSWWVCVPMFFWVQYEFAKELILICQALVEILTIQVLKICGYIQNCKSVCVTKLLQAPILLLGMRTSATQWQCISMIHYLAFNRLFSILEDRNRIIMWARRTQTINSQDYCWFHSPWGQPKLLFKSQVPKSYLVN